MKPSTSFAVLLGIVIILLVYNSYPQVNKKELNNRTHSSATKFLKMNGSLSGIDDQVEQNDLRNLLPNQQAKFKAVQNGAIKSEGKTLNGGNWITTYRQITTYENNLVVKKGYQYFDLSGKLICLFINYKFL